MRAMWEKEENDERWIDAAATASTCSFDYHELLAKFYAQKMEIIILFTYRAERIFSSQFFWAVFFFP